ncbi:expressed unknown protein [Seminavis robusta]|uniref:Uncharacterized protein n=1 Tax=Seminavis robusta TaxID=568900 RepID=A0A9N8GZM7_9STRA|nr:expressed unknown protein [Seminavis robusta]|eukprot:Sro6_g004940.1 n/a (176) ;mRNA; r:53353-53880
MASPIIANRDMWRGLQFQVEIPTTGQVPGQRSVIAPELLFSGQNAETKVDPKYLDNLSQFLLTKVEDDHLRSHIVTADLFIKVVDGLETAEDGGTILPVWSAFELEGVLSGLLNNAEFDAENGILILMYLQPEAGHAERHGVVPVHNNMLAALELAPTDLTEEEAMLLEHLMGLS